MAARAIHGRIPHSWHPRLSRRCGQVARSQQAGLPTPARREGSHRGVGWSSESPAWSRAARAEDALMTTAARSSLTATIASRPITAYVVIAYAVSWTLTLLCPCPSSSGCSRWPDRQSRRWSSHGARARSPSSASGSRRGGSPIVWYALAFGIPFAGRRRRAAAPQPRRPGAGRASARSAPSSSSCSCSSSGRKSAGVGSCSRS